MIPLYFGGAPSQAPVQVTFLLTNNEIDARALQKLAIWI